MKSKKGLEFDNIGRGYLGELLAAADLNYRLGRAYLNPEPQTKDDVYAKSPSAGWLTVQVKLGRVKNIRTGMLTPNHRWKVTSDLFAVVDLEGMRIRYLPGAKELPPEITPDVTPICSRVALIKLGAPKKYRPGPTPRSFSEEERTRILELRKAGSTHREIGRELGRAPGTIGAFLFYEKTKGEV